jgi:hypothetical protein
MLASSCERVRENERKLSSFYQVDLAKLAQLVWALAAMTFVSLNLAYPL